MNWVTRIEEDGAQLLVCGCGQLDDGEACISSRAVVIVHRDLEVCALQVGDGDVHSEALAAAPGNLQDTQED